MRIAMIGTRGVPARYGGFESAVEEIGARLAARGHEVVVYCRNPGQRLSEHRGMRLVNLPALRLRWAETLSHAGASTAHVIVREKPDVAFLFNAANAPYLAALQRAGIPVAINIDGMESRRGKWAGLGARYFRAAERLGVRRADAVIADSQAIAAHVRDEHAREAVFIPYGAVAVEPGDERLAGLGLRRDGYHLIVARFEPENQVRELVEGYRSSGARLPLVVVGAAPYAAEYTAGVRAAASPPMGPAAGAASLPMGPAAGAASPQVLFLGAVWDAQLLDELYAGALTYLHGHSVGGTNPSLLRAMAAGAPVVAHDNPFNREVAGAAGHYVGDVHGIGPELLAAESDPDAARARGAEGRRSVTERYDWSDVARRYEELAIELTSRSR